MNIQGILNDWKDGLTHGGIKDKYNITDEQEFAITLCSDRLSISEIVDRLANLKPGMKGVEIKAIMDVTWLDEMLAKEQEAFRVDVGVDVQDYCPVSLSSILEMTANGQVYLGDLGNEELEE